MVLEMRTRITIVVVTAVVLAGCGGGSPETDIDSDTGGLKIYRHSMDEMPTSLDPVQSANVYANHVNINAYDTLYAYKYLARPYTLKANLAADFPEIAEDGLTYTIRIKQGVYFVDDPAFPDGKGREVVAEDFVYSIKRHFDPTTRPQGAWLWQGRIVGLDEWKEAGSDYSAEVEGLRALDRYTIQVRLIRPYPQLLYTFTQGYSAIVPVEAVEKYGREFASRPVGSGPFKVVSYDTSKIVFDRNPNYRQEPVDLEYEGYDPARHSHLGLKVIEGRAPPFVDRLEINFINESSARWNSFTKGNEIQFATLPIEIADQVLSSKDPVTLQPEYDFPEFGYNPDPAREARNNALRCAILKSLSWEQRNESFYMGLGQVFPGIIVPVVPEYDPSVPRDSVTRDLEGARKLLRDNDWTAENLPELVYGTTSGVTNRLQYEQYRAWLKEVGYPPEKIILKQYATFGDISKAWKESQLPWVSKGWGLDYPDAENTLQLFYGPNASPGSNDANYRNPEYDRLYEESSVMLPSPQRTALYRKMNRILIDDCIAMTGLSRTRIYLWHKDVIAMPDREIVGGFFLKFVDIVEDSSS
jgi:ABC-type transport system substrate-binding protein